MKTREQPERHFDVDDPDLAASLGETWSPGKGIVAWLSDVNHMSIGKRFLVTAFTFFLLGGVEALLMRTQLARANNRFLSPEIYDQIFTTHVASTRTRPGQAGSP